MTRPIKTVFTNGCFDLFHDGHRHLLYEASRLGDKLIVAVNSDASVRQLKGGIRPVHTFATRAENVESFLRLIRPSILFEILRFEAREPGQLIESERPDVLVKGSDAARPLSGEEYILRCGGRVVIIERLPGLSTTSILESQPRS
jgi:rfaE bifunctional protein nucleotidyltransferase chain/domain